jgi:hypothetical protein
MYYLILTIILWRSDGMVADAAPTIQKIEFRDEVACNSAAAKWKAGVMGARPNRPGQEQPIYALSAECVAIGGAGKAK